LPRQKGVAVQRRAIIRATWQRLYRDERLFRTRFVITRPAPDWIQVIAAESEAYGDIIILPHLEENHYVANHAKSIEFFKWLAAQGHDWQFVSKIDDDCFVDPFAFWTEYLKPLSARMAETSELRTVVARKLTRRPPARGLRFSRRPVLYDDVGYREAPRAALGEEPTR
jgi:hypothetical protein